MGKFQAIHTYLAVIVVLVVSHEVATTQGRQIKALNRHSWMGKDTSSNVPTSSEMAVNAYRPTTPGNSPGVGHRKVEQENKDIKAKVVVQSPPDVEDSLTEGSKTDFRPTDPGHSPGVGHSAHH